MAVSRRAKSWEDGDRQLPPASPGPRVTRQLHRGRPAALFAAGIERYSTFSFL